MIWTVTPSGTYVTELREDLDLLAGTSLEYDGSLPGAYTAAAAELAFRVSQGVSLALSTMFLASAPSEVVVARAAEAGLTPGPATRSRYIVKLAGSGEVPNGAFLQGGGPLGRTRWQVVDETGNVASGGDVTIEAVDTGPIALSGITSFTTITPITGVTGYTYDPSDGDPFQLGVDEETVGSLRVRTGRERSRGGSYASIARTLQDIDWITATDVRQGTGGAGTIAITVVPAPVGADQEAELAAALYASTPGGATLEGASSLATPDVNGQTTAVFYAVGAQQAVAVVAELVSDGTITPADLEDTITAAIEAFFAGLDAGDTAYFTRFSAAVLGLPGVIGSTSLTLNAGVVDVAPALAADVLVASPITVSVS